MTSYYVYYRIDAKRVDAFRLSIQDLFKIIEQKTSIRGRWMRRRDDPATFMEVYEGVKDEQAFESVLAREAATLKLERKVERFVDA